MSDIIQCPQCDRKLRVPEPLRGKAVKCPTCGVTFAADMDVVEAEEQPAADMPARRPADVEHEAPVRRRAPKEAPGGDYDEDAWDEDFEPEESQGGRPRRRRTRGRTLDSLTNDYSIDIGKWFNVASAHYSSVLGPFIGFILLLAVMNIVAEFLIFIPLLGILIAIATILSQIPLQAGIPIVILKQLKGEPWTFGDFFSGFQFFGSLLGNFFLVLLIVAGCMLPSIVVWIVAGLGGGGVLITGAAVFSVLNYLAAIYLLVRATIFNTQFIVDYNCGPVDAIQATWTVTRGHFWGLLGSVLLLALIGAAGYLACGIGALFTIPFATLALNAGYCLIAGSRPPVQLSEPPPPRRRVRDDDAEDMD